MLAVIPNVLDTHRVPGNGSQLPSMVVIVKSSWITIAPSSSSTWQFGQRHSTFSVTSAPSRDSVASIRTIYLCSVVDAIAGIMGRLMKSCRAS